VPSFSERRKDEVRRIYLPRTWVNNGRKDRNKAPCHSRFARGLGRRTDGVRFGPPARTLRDGINPW
jgi:hypothetical protein